MGDGVEGMTMIKYIVVFVLGCAAGVGGAAYHYDSQVRAATNAQVDHAIAQGAASAHTALTAPASK